MRNLLFLLFLPISYSFIYGTSGSNEYLNSLKKNNNRIDYLDSLKKQSSFYSKSRKPLTNPNNTNISPVQLINATFVINNLGSSPFKIKKNDIKKENKDSSGGHFQLKTIENYNFSSIGGYKEIKQELLQMLDIIQNPTNYTKYKIRLPKGVLLYGPPGNGKTLLARCFAGESKLPIIATSGSEFQEKYVGTGPARIRELFEFARENSPCMIFIDEIDAVARKRGSDGESSTAERDSTLNQLLVELDGFDSFLDNNIFIISSTNRIDILDPALLRPGRMDKKIQVPTPDKETRKEILDIHLEQKPIETDFEYLLNDITEGMSGAEIEHLLNEVILEGIRKRSLPILTEDLEAMKERIMVGNDYQNTIVTGEFAFRIAVHEMGHALVGYFSTNHQNPKKVTIRSTNRMLGYTLFPAFNGSLHTLANLEDRIKVLLAGRIAEEIIFGSESISTGASDDLQKCQHLAHDMILLYGMGRSLIYPNYSDRSKREIDDAIFQIIQKNYYIAKTMLKENENSLIKLSHLLVEKASIKFEDIINILKN